VCWASVINWHPGAQYATEQMRWQKSPMPRALLVKTGDVLVALWTMRDASFGAVKIYLPRLLGGAVSDDETHKDGDAIAASAARGTC
jgi:hypothetical protein